MTQFLDEFTYHNLYIVRGHIVESRGCLMIDYVSISFAVKFCLVIWGSFLAISGLEESWPKWLITKSCCKKWGSQRLPLNWIEAETYIFSSNFYKLIKICIAILLEKNKFIAASSRWHSAAACRSKWFWYREPWPRKHRPCALAYRSQLFLAIKYHDTENIFEIVSWDKPSILYL